MADQEYDTAADRITAEGEAVRKAAEDARDSNESQAETEEEYYERIEAARATGIFGDTPTDPTTGDIDTPTQDENQATADVSEVDAEAEADADSNSDEKTEEQKQSSTQGDPRKAKRQRSAPAQEVQSASDKDDLSDVGRKDSDEKDSDKK